MSGDKKKALSPTGLAAWDLFLRSIAEGVPLEEACLKHMVTTRDIDSITRSNLAEDKKWQAARLAAERCAWSQLDLDEIFDRIGAGTSVLDAVSAVRGKDDSAAFFRLVEGTEGLLERFFAAQRQWAMREAAKLVDIADDDDDDTLPGPKGGTIPNMAAVQRARLRIETRKDLMSDWSPRMFGKQKQEVEVNVNVDLVARMERAHQAARDRKVTPRQIEEAIDATFEPVVEKPTPVRERAEPVPPSDSRSFDTTWLEANGPVDVTKPAAATDKQVDVDVPSEPMDTTWLEEK